jgi:hypothetical protein
MSARAAAIIVSQQLSRERKRRGERRSVKDRKKRGLSRARARAYSVLGWRKAWPAFLVHVHFCVPTSRRPSFCSGDCSSRCCRGGFCIKKHIIPSIFRRTQEKEVSKRKL